MDVEILIKGGKMENKVLKNELFKKLGLPNYGFTEELLNALTHGVGSLLSILAFFVIFKKYSNDRINLIFMLIYCFTLFLLYMVSTLYHSLKKGKTKAIFRKFDHCSIFLLIAGTYTPICASILKTSFAFYILAGVWILAIVGIILNSIDVNKFSKFSLTCYILMGWSIVFIARPVLEILNHDQLICLLTGGVLYTVGAVVYVIGKKVKFMHCVWHIFVLAGSIFHFLIFTKQIA